jgi:hypothetical protein
MTAWIVLRTSGRSTLPLARSLSSDGFEAWTPSAKIRPQGRRGKLCVPIIPTFVFARARHLWNLVSLSDDPLSRHEGFSVMRHMDGRGYPLVEDSELEPLRSEEGRVIPKEERKVLGCGEIVRLPEGPFAGMSGIVESADHKHAWVRFGGFRQPVKIAAFLLRSDMSERFRLETDMAA